MLMSEKWLLLHLIVTQIDFILEEKMAEFAHGNFKKRDSELLTTFLVDINLPSTSWNSMGSSWFLAAKMELSPFGIMSQARKKRL